MVDVSERLFAYCNEFVMLRAVGFRWGPSTIATVGLTGILQQSAPLHADLMNCWLRCIDLLDGR